MSEQPKPWQRQDGETVKAFTAFCQYRDLGLARTLKRGYELYAGLEIGSRRGDPPPYYQDWSAKNRWIKRAQEYDEYMLEMQREAEEEKVRSGATKWADRLENQREQEYLYSEQLLERAGEMLQAPLFRTEETKDGKTIIVMPADWKAADIVSFLKAASMLARLAIGEESRRLDDTGKQYMIVSGQKVEF